MAYQWPRSIDITAAYAILRNETKPGDIQRN